MKVGLICIGIICVICFVMSPKSNKDWTIRFKPELDHFFGEVNWECISKETKKSTIYSKSDGAKSTYTNWYIRFYNKTDKEEVWSITDHVLRINNAKHGLFSPKRYSIKQAFYLELMEISCGLVGNDIFDEFIRSELSENEANCIDASIHYYGQPEPKFYDALSEEEWFTAEKARAEDYLSYELQDFRISISAHDYYIKKLTVQERQNVFDSLEKIEKKLLDRYGDIASFRIFFDAEHKVEYRDGRKQ